MPGFTHSEPMPLSRRMLEANLRLNLMGDRVYVVPKRPVNMRAKPVLSLPCRSSKIRLIENGRIAQCQSLRSDRDQIRVPVTTLDEFIAGRGRGPVDLMKIDVETFEPQVLRGSRRILGEHRPIIFLEILPKADEGALEEIRLGNNYIFGCLVPEGIRWESTVRQHPSGYDYVLCPAEKRDQLHRATQIARLRVTGCP